MRRLALAILALSTLSACAALRPSAPPAPTAAAESPPAVVVLAPPPIDIAPMRVEPRLLVRATKATKLYTGPGTFYLYIRDLAAGAAVEYLGNRSGWLKVRTAEGENGWLPVADAELTDGRGQAVTYGLGSSRWQMKLATGFALDLARAGTGVMRMTLTGLTAAAEVIPVGGGTALAVRTTLPAGLQVAGDIGDSSVGRVSLTEQGILIDLERQPLHRVVENAGGKLVLEIRPGLMGLESLGEGGWRLTYRGDLAPVLRQEGAELVLDLPGAMLGPSVKAGAQLQEVGPEAGATTPSPGAANALPPVRMAAGGLRFRAPAPGRPYALYRSAPGQLELRYLTPTLAGKTVVIDPGHGGEETGAVGPGGHVEKDINLAVGLRLKPLLEQAGAKVIMTRSDDTRVLPRERWAEATSSVERTQLDLAARSAMSNSAGADLYVSIHANGGPQGDGGTEVYWASSNLNALLSQRLARLAQQELLSALGLFDRGYKQRPFNVIRMSDAPAMLVEMGFMTDWSEEQLLAAAQGQQAAAEAMLRAVRRYFEEP